MIFIEKAKTFVSDKLEDLFLYEMQILNYDKVLPQAEKTKRFYEIVKKILESKGPSTKLSILPEDHPDNRRIVVVGQLIGPNLIWSRGVFE